jgi:GNAT superfamily N-acetyltransferase
MSGLAIRSASPADIPAIINLQKQTWWVTYEHIVGKEQCDFMFDDLYTDASLTRQMTASGHRFFLLEQEGELLGFASCSEREEERIVKLEKLYVIPAAQGTGAGRRLVAAVEAYAKSKGAAEIRLNVNRYNPARHFYEKMGFAVLYEEDVPIGSYWMNDYVMGKKI